VMAPGWRSISIVPSARRAPSTGAESTTARGNVVKPNGETYVNDDDNWTWLINVAGKAARWLGYIPFGRIADNRNAPPIIHRKASVAPQTFVSIGLDVTIPDADDLNPQPSAEGFEPRQAFHFAMFGEKGSLEDVLLPIARAKQADLYLPTGEISDTLLHQIAKDANDDGRAPSTTSMNGCAWRRRIVLHCLRSRYPGPRSMRTLQGLLP
jgi:hypothetical protein